MAELFGHNELMEYLDACIAKAKDDAERREDKDDCIAMMADLDFTRGD